MRLLFLLALASGCFYTDKSPLPADFGACTAPDDNQAIADPTWFRDVEPIVVAKCQGCHTDGGIAPFPLSSYNEVSAVHTIIRDAIDTRRMPPWQPAQCCNHYLYDRSLTDAEHATLLAWIDAGAPSGDPADEHVTMTPPQGLPRVDMTAAMPVAFTPSPKIGVDELRCFLLDHDPIDRTRYITGFDFHPGVRGEVHHVIVFAVGGDEAGKLAKRDGADGRPGWDCYGQGGEITSDAKIVGGWQPGVTARVLPDGIGRELAKGSRLVLNVHYDTGHGTAPDLSTIDLMLADSVERVEKGIPVGNPLWFAGDGMKIPANAPDTEVWFAWDPSDLVTHGTVELHDVMLHMHELGSLGRVAILRGNGDVDCLLNITEWDFHWMADYYFETPVRLDPGDKLYVECHWDNTAGHQKIIDGVQQPPRDLHWGTDEEMCGAVLYYSVKR